MEQLQQVKKIGKTEYSVNLMLFETSKKSLEEHLLRCARDEKFEKK